MYNAASQKEKTCLSEVSLADSVTCLVYNMRKVFAGTAAGQVVVYKKNKLGKQDLSTALHFVCGGKLA